MIGYEALKIMHENPNARFQFGGNVYRVSRDSLEVFLCGTWDRSTCDSISMMHKFWERLPDERPRLSDAQLLADFKSLSPSLYPSERAVYDGIIAELEARIREGAT